MFFIKVTSGSAPSPWLQFLFLGTEAERTVCVCVRCAHIRPCDGLTNQLNFSTCGKTLCLCHGWPLGGREGGEDVGSWKNNRNERMRRENWGTKQERPTVEAMLEGRERQRSGARGRGKMIKQRKARSGHGK